MPESGKEKRETQVLREALTTIRELRKRLEEKENLGQEPIAVTGMACRFPGGSTTPEAFWTFLKRGGDGVKPIPAGRWKLEDFYDPNPGKPGKMYVKEAAFLQEEIGEFDARFFGISPREAEEMDPQHRLLLEVSWEALERAGQAPAGLRGSQTGVFVGILGASEYGSIPRPLGEPNPYTGTGLAANTASGRISHILGIHGPALSVDTACSSSLVCVHLACESLRRRECDAALAGGVNLMLAPYIFVILSHFRALSPEGRCKTFDAAADGYGRGEGCGMVVLKRLVDAQKEGDPILAVIKGSAVNNDGPGSGLTVPNGLAQQALYRKALEKAGIAPEEIGYLETHGTGTALGDPIEMQSIAMVYGKNRSRENPLLIGAVKANIGHLEAAAGIAGLIKAIHCVRHKEIPPQVNLNTLNPNLHPGQIPAIIPREKVRWNTNGKPAAAGISSFGFSGTNAHIVITEPPAAPPATCTPVERPLHILALSAKTPGALAELIDRYKTYLEDHPGENPADICYAANAGRSHFTGRAAITAPGTAGLRQRLTDSVEIHPGETGEEERPKIAFYFGGTPDDRIVEMGTVLYETQPVFRAALDKTRESYAPQTGRMEPGKTDAYLLAVEYGLTRMWESWGVKPSAVMGEGVGILAAASAAGVMDLETAVEYLLEPGEKNCPDRKLAAPQVRIVSNISGQWADKSETASFTYWQKQRRTPAQWEKGTQALIRQGIRWILEIGTVPREKMGAGNSGNGDVHFLKGEGKPWEDLLRHLAQLYCRGVEIDWQGFDAGYDRRKPGVPVYPFQKKRYWIEALPFTAPLNKPGPGHAGHAEHEADPGENPAPIIKKREVSPLPDRHLEFRIYRERIPEIFDNTGTLHIGYYLEMLTEAVEELYGDKTYTMKGMEFISGLALEAATTRPVHLVIGPGDNGRMGFQFYSQDAGRVFWTMHAAGEISLEENPGFPLVSSPQIEAIQARCTSRYTAGDFYGMMEKRGFQFGPGVRWVQRAWYREGEALAQFREPRETEKNRGFRMLHPGIWDACNQVFFAAFSRRIDEETPFMVIKLTDFSFCCRERDPGLWCHAVLNQNPGAAGIVEGRFNLWDKNGKWVAQAKQCRLKELKKIIEALKQYGKESESPQPKGKNQELTALLKASSREKQKEILEGYLREKIGALLHMPESELEMKEPLRNLGMDSLIAVDYKKVIETDLPVEIPIETLIQGPSIGRLAESLVGALSPGKPGETPTDIAAAAAAETTAYKLEPTLWLDRPTPRPGVKLCLYCLPYGGGGASIYRRWHEKFPPQIEVVPIQLPGRENRLKEKPIDNIREMEDVLEGILAPRVKIPYAFYGHSYGALIAYRLAHRLWKTTREKPGHLFVAAYTSPKINPNPLLARLLAHFQSLGYRGIPGPGDISHLASAHREESLGIIPEIRALGQDGKTGEALVKAVLPMLLADMKVVESYTYEKEEIFDIPITAFHGERDERVDVAGLEAWKELTNAAFQLHEMKGDHFFMHREQDQENLINLIIHRLEDYWK